MPKAVEVIQYYKDNGLPVRCVYCGGTNDLTKDHIIPKSRVPTKIRTKRWRNKDKDPHAYYGQFNLCCEKCNQMKGRMTHDEFIAHLKKINEFTAL